MKLTLDSRIFRPLEQQGREAERTDLASRILASGDHYLVFFAPRPEQALSTCSAGVAPLQGLKKS